MSDNILEIFATSYMWLLEHMFLINVVFSFLMAPRYGISMVWVALPIGWLINYLVSYSAFTYYKRLGKLNAK